MIFRIADVSWDLPVPIGEVWGIVGSFGAIKAWMPAIRTCSVAGAGIGAIRTVTVATSPDEVYERLTLLDPTTHRIGYDFREPRPLPVAGLEAFIELTELPNRQTRLHWVAQCESPPPDGAGAFLTAFYEENCRTLHALLTTGR